MSTPKTKAEQRAKRLPTKAEREVLTDVLGYIGIRVAWKPNIRRYRPDCSNFIDTASTREAAAFRRLARELRARAEGKSR